MKTLFFCITFLFCATGFAVENFFPVGKENAKTVYTKQAKCEQVEGQPCFDVSNKDPRWHEAVVQTVDDQSKPIYKPKYNLKACSTANDCQTKMSAEGQDYCQNGDMMAYEKNQVMPGYSYFCYGITGYEQKQQTVLVENSDLKAQVLAAEQEKKQLEEQIAERRKKIAFGQRMIAYMGVLNDSKNLSVAQSQQFLQEVAPVMQLFQAGAIETAKDAISGITPDGTVITQADKDALLAEVNSYLGQ